jgi:LysM repeat protein
MRILIFCLIVFPSQLVFAQQAKFVARKNGNDIFVEHKVQPKENWYSVGRMYLISPKEIAQFNGLTMSKGLGIGQSLRVPLVSNNFSQASDAGVNGTPVYHEVQSK